MKLIDKPILCETNNLLNAKFKTNDEFNQHEYTIEMDKETNQWTSKDCVAGELE